MIFSRRAYAWEGAKIEQDRALSASWVLRSCETVLFRDDERPLASSTVGRGTEASRARLTLLVRGRAAVELGGETVELGPGEAVVAAPISRLFAVELVPSTIMEIDWTPARPATFFGRLQAGPALFAELVALSGAVRRRAPEEVTAVGRRVFARLTASGLETPGDDRLWAPDPLAQGAMAVLDELLCDLSAQPQMVDLEARLALSRWSLTRRIRDLHAAYGLSGFAGGTDWRSLRDFTRVRVAGIMMTHPAATTQAVARQVGYGSAEAMCHAFANAGLPAPRALAPRSRG